MKFLKRYQLQLFLLCWLLLYPLFPKVTGIGCPIREFLGFQCPGCGMTRAVVSALRLDFAAAFSFHPAWWVLPVAAVLFSLFAAKKMKAAQNITLAAAVSVILAAHAARCFF